MIHGECRTRKKNLSSAWIDYKIAFDSVRHSLIVKCKEIYKICHVVTHFITATMNTWKSTLVLTHTGGLLTSRAINIKRGIFPGYSLQSLPFCMALVPLSHVFFMDGLKTYAKDDNQQATTKKSLLHSKRGREIQRRS